MRQFRALLQILRMQVPAAHDDEVLDPAGHEPDATEFIEVRAFPFTDVLNMVERSEIVDAMTVVAACRRRTRGRTCPGIRTTSGAREAAFWRTSRIRA